MSDPSLNSQRARSASGVTSSVSARAFAQTLDAVPATPTFPPPNDPSHTPMSLSRSPSPQPNGGWETRGLTDERTASPDRIKGDMNGFANNDAQWAAARQKSAGVRGYPTIQTKNEGFFKRTRRQVSQVLPTFNTFSPQDKSWRDQEKLGRGRWAPQIDEGRFAVVRTYLGNVLRKFKFVFLVLGIVALLTTLLAQISRSLPSDSGREHNANVFHRCTW